MRTKEFGKQLKILFLDCLWQNYNELVFGEKLCSKSIIKVIEQFIKLVQTSSTFFIFTLQVANCYV